MLQLGCAQKIIEVPLFAELFGYGPFTGRRNLGTHDPLYCRAAVFDYGSSKAVIIYSDLTESIDEQCRLMRSRLAKQFHFPPENIAFTSTHTHTAPNIGSVEDGIGFGYPDSTSRKNWRQAVVECVGNALNDVEPVGRIEAGRVPITHKIAENRVSKKSPLTDPDIRWLRFFRKNDSPKLLIHNHAIHGVAFNGPVCGKLVSADWMGAANTMIHDRELADYAIFLQGTSGDINPLVPNPTDTGTEKAPLSIAGLYLDDLSRGLKNGTALEVKKLTCKMKLVALPMKFQTPQELRKDAATLIDVTRKMSKDHQGWAANLAARLEETAILSERGLLKKHMYDFQTFNFGGAEIDFIPGEMFIAPGLEIINRNRSKVILAATCSNGNAGYFFTKECAARYPDISCYSDKACFGYYEIYGYMHAHSFKFSDTIADFITDILTKEQ